MEIIRIPRLMQDTSKGHAMRGRTIGFVPTMGALHEGHLSLVRMARQENDVTVVSIYVNPMQFGPSEDFSRYPRDLEGDAEKLEREGADILFVPDNSLMFSDNFSTHVEVEGLSERLCGQFRPGHFRGVATVVTKLFNIINPQRAYFGQKDYQQCLIIKRLVNDLNMNIEVIACPTVREADGLAMSSRNLYLSHEERNAAQVIYKALSETSKAIKSGIIETGELKKKMRGILNSQPLVKEIQYCSLYDPETLEELDKIGREALIAVALRIGNTRLIDSMIVMISR